MREREAFQELDYRAVFGTHGEMGDRDRRSGAHPRDRLARVLHRDCNGRPGPVVIALPEDMLIERVAVPDAPAFEPVETWPGLADMAKLQKLLWAAQAADRARSAAAAGRRPRCAALARFAERFALPVATTFRRAQLFDPMHPCYAGDLGIGANPKLLARIKACRPDRADRRPARRNAVAGLHAARHSGAAADARACPSRAPRNSAASIVRISRSTPRRPRSPRRWKACSRRTRSPGATQTKAAHAEYLAWTETRDAAARRASTSARSWCGCARICRRTPSSATAPAISPPGCTASTASAASPRHIGADLRLDGLRRAGGGRHEAALSRADGGVRHRRRRFPDERPGVRHRRAVRAADHRRRLRQRHLRHHPHAPGARISRPRVGDRAARIRTSPPMREPSAASASRWRRPRISPRRFEAAEKSGKPAIIHLKVDTNASTPGLTLEGIRAKALASPKP